MNGHETNLTDDELRMVWKRTEAQALWLLVRFILLTSARRSEAAEMTWGEVDGQFGPCLR